MPTASYTVQIDINSKGARVITRDFSAVSKQAKATEGTVNLLRRAMVGLGAVFGIRKLIEYSDSIANLRNRLSLLTNSTGDVFLATQNLLDIATRTRSNFDATAQVYTRLALSARNLGLSNQELLTITEALNQAVILSGTTSREAANGLIQLSQAIASNRLGGDELRSVLEQLPLVADIIGKEMVRLGLATRGTRGEIRQLGFEGKITAEIITGAMLRASEELRKSFEKTTPTIAQAFEVLQTGIIRAVDDFNRFSNAGGILARVLLLIADNLDLIIKLLAPIIGGLLIGKLATMIKGFVAMKTAVGALTLTFGGWVALISAAIIGLVVLANKFRLFEGDITRFNGEAMKEMNDAFKDFDKLSVDAQDKLVSLTAELQKYTDFLEKEADRNLFSRAVLGASNSEIAAAQRKVIELKQQIVELTRSPAVADPTKEQKDQADLLAKIVRELNNEYRGLQLTNREREISNDLARIEERLRGKKLSGEALAKALQEVEVLVRRNKAQEEYQEILNGLRQPSEEFERTNANLQKIIEKYPELADKARVAMSEAYAEFLSSGRRAVDGLNKAQIEQQLEFSNAAKFAGDAYRELTDPALQYKATIQGINDVLEVYPELQGAANRKMAEARIQLLETQTTMAAGFERGLLKIRNDVTDLASAADQLLTNAFSNAEDAFLDFVTTGKASFTDLINSLQRDIARLAFRGLIANTLGNAIGVGGEGSGGFNLAQMIGNFFGGNKPAGAAPPAAPATQNAGSFARGGEFTVGGSGGIDSKMVAFRATPGERVTVQTKRQQERTQRPINFSMTVVTPDSQSFQRSQGQIAARQQRMLMKAGARNN